MAEKRRSLFDITQDMRALLWAVTDGQDPDDRVHDELEACRAEMDEKIEACLGLSEVFGAQALAFMLRSRVYAEQSKRLEKRRARLVEYVKTMMTEAGLDKTTTARYPAITIRKNPPKLFIGDDAVLPDRWLEVVKTIKILKPEIKAALKAGEDVPGCSLEQGTRLEY